MSEQENTTDSTVQEMDALFERVLGELGISLELDLARYDNLREMVDAALREHADKPAFTSLGRTLSYREVDQLSGQFASWLQHHTDLEPGDRIAVQTPNLIQYPVVVFGALRAGMVIVNTNPLYLSLIHISEPTRRRDSSRMPSSA